MLTRPMARRLSSTGRLSCFTRSTSVCSSSYNLRTFSTQPQRTSTDGQSDSLVVTGSGVAGCAAALVAAQRYRIPVKLVFAGDLPQDCNSYWAQGGIIYKNDDPKSGDSPQSLAADIMRAGAGLCVEEAVYKLATEGPDRVKELLLDDANGVFANVPFDRDEDGNLSCCLEASHAAPRIIHYADHTGKLITQHITAAAARHPLIELVPNTLVTDLLVQDNVCVGVATFNRATGAKSVLNSPHGTVLASGGLGGIYQHSTNPAGFNALGSSVALAQRASVTTRDLEYVQFHPTSLNIPNQARFLLTEALRGEGAVLRDKTGRAFAKDFHLDGELAPRDVVARGVFETSQKEPNNCFLDISHRDASWLYKRFPSIHAHLQTVGLDLAHDGLPVIPAAHYTCGGIATDMQGKTSLRGLYAAGEAARTGLHGGNRLASTSLLEGLVFGASVADHVGSEQGVDHYHAARDILFKRDSFVPPVVEFANINGSTTPSNKSKMDRATTLLQQVRKTMWDNVGVVRTPQGLTKAKHVLDDIKQEAEDLYGSHVSVETIALRDAAYSGSGVAEAAYENRISAGAHCIVNDESAHDDDSDDDDEMMLAMTAQ